MPFCTYCGQSFTRDEHLERHILTHTNVKPYKCLTCHMSFARRDLLQRHYVVHGKDATEDSFAGPNGFLAKTAGRTPIACHNCAKTKTKCDKKFPCTRCATRDLTCTVRPTRRATKNGAIAQQVEEGQGHYSTGSSSSSSQSGSDRASPSATSSSACPPPSLSNELESSSELSEVGAIDSSEAHRTPMRLDTGQMPGMFFEDITPLSDCDDFFGMDPVSGCYAGQLPSPPLPNGQSMMDWGQMAFHYDPSKPQDLLMSPTMAFDPNVFMDVVDGQFVPHYHTSMMETQPDLHETFSDRRSSADTRTTNATDYDDQRDQLPEDIDMEMSYQTDPVLLEALSAAHDSWSVFRCNPCIPSSECPKTARLNLETLEQSLKNHNTWTEFDLSSHETEHVGSHTIQVVPLQEMLRDKLMAITQTFVHKALDTHKAEPGVSDARNSSNFVLLPPRPVLELFLSKYTECFEQYYSLIPKSTLDANELMRNNNDRAASLLILLMIAVGASITTGEGQSLTAGLVEACRISLFDIVERNIIMASDHVVLLSALLFTIQGAWSGDKWQMDIAMGQRGLYSNMLRHSGRLEPRTPKPQTTHRVDTRVLWDEWTEQESRSRLIYAWVMVDQETSLFHDTAPIFSVTELGEPMPSSDSLWDASTLPEWTKLFDQIYEEPNSYAAIGPDSRPLSLRGIFRHFLDDGIVAKRIDLTPLHLRLLLHPLQALVYQSRQLLSCFPDKTAARRGSKSISAASTRVQLKEATTLLLRWYALAERYMKTKPLCPAMQANLVTYHLISLNAFTDFAGIEQLARRDEGDLSSQRLPMLHKRCITDVEQVMIHCGQILRHIRSMAPNVRPPWWAAAIYRVAMILWTVSLDNQTSGNQCTGSYDFESSFAVDTIPPQHPMVVRYLQEKEGTPLLTKQDGSMLAIDNPVTLLLYCTQVIAEGVPTRFTDGLRLKLTRLAKDGSR